MARQQTKTEIGQSITGGRGPKKRRSVVGNGLIFTVGAYRERRTLTDESTIEGHSHAALRCIDLITPPSCSRHSTSSPLFVLVSGMPACSHGGLSSIPGYTAFCLTWAPKPWDINPEGCRRGGANEPCEHRWGTAGPSDFSTTVLSGNLGPSEPNGCRVPKAP